MSRIVETNYGNPVRGIHSQPTRMLVTHDGSDETILYFEEPNFPIRGSPRVQGDT